MNDLTAKAVAALANGYSVIPAGANKIPKIPWKRFQHERPPESQILQWADELDPEAWGIVTGQISNVVVLDFDGEPGLATLERLGLEPHIRTGSGGFHVYVEYPGWPVTTVSGKTRKALGERYPGMDVRGDGGYAVFAGRNEKGSYEQLRTF